MPLTDATVRALKPKQAPYKLSDSEGLYVLVTTAGSRLWSLAYRFHSKQKTLALGKYPAVSLLDARRARDAAKQLLAAGTDPAADRRATKRKRSIAAANTFEAVAQEWFEVNKGRWVETYSSRLQSRLNDDLLPALGKRPIADIEPLEILDAIRKIERRDAIEMAKRVMQMASGIFRYGVATARCTRDPTADLKGALKPAKATKHRTALPAKELPSFVEALEAYDGEPVTKLGMKLLLLTFVRTSELRFARWSQFEKLGSREALWRIPAERMKMRREHLVPLAPQAVGVIELLQKRTGNSEYLFPAATKHEVISENTLLFAIYRMGYHSRATVHGFRATASTILNEAQFNRDWIEMQLAHFDGSVRGTYNGAEWLPGRRDMMCWWANYLDGTKKRRLEIVKAAI
ncbi:MAG: integrase arm-type DNA-binding domain-containing protein [Alphaproteobacteria bacterium]|nr:integrase arm-type DNA-binding domain-containing protein [Alphaproteobacteria bacterium]